MSAVAFAVKAHGGGIHAITAPMGEMAYLVEGAQRAAVIDTGMGVGSLKACLRTLTQKPLIALNTHGHPDHAGGNMEFDNCRMHPADAALFRDMCSKEFRRFDIRRIGGGEKPELESALLDDAALPAPLADGEIIDLGDRMLTAFHAPGHTPGCACFWDEQSKSLFVGDMLSGQAVWMYDGYSEPLRVYLKSLEALGGRFPEISRIFIGHQPCVLPPEALPAHIECARRILAGANGVPHRTFAGEGLLYRHGGVAIVYNPERLH